MSHLSIQEFNHIVEAASRWYVQDNDAGADTAQQYLEAFKAARLKQLKKTSAESVYSLSVNAPEALDIYEAARFRANSESDNNSKEVFVEKLKAELHKEFIIEEPVFAVINRIDQQIQLFNSPANWFQFSAKAKIAALEALKETLLTRRRGTIGAIIEEWMEEHENTIASSRNIFKGKSKAPNTTTLKFINDLKADYDQESLAIAHESDPSLSRKDKQKIYQPFLNYIQARTTWFQQLITFIFRNKSLSKDKLAFAQALIEEVQDSKDSYSTLAEMLNAKRAEHAEMSEACKKFHNNLRAPNRNEDAPHQPPSHVMDNYELMETLPQKEPKTAIPFWQRCQEVKEGKSFTNSDLAEAFHESINAMRT